MVGKTLKISKNLADLIGNTPLLETQIAKRTENKGNPIIALLPDIGERYLSTLVF